MERFHQFGVRFFASLIFLTAVPFGVLGQIKPGAPCFTSSGDYTFPTGSRTTGSAVVADFNNDGFPDVLSGSFVPGTVTLQVNNGSGKLKVTTVVNEVAGSVELVAADFDGDGSMDAAAIRNETLSVFPGDGKGGFGRTLTYKVPIADNFVVGDFTGDGFPDFVTSAYAGNVNLLVRQNDGSFSSEILVTNDLNGGYLNVLIGDFNNDKKLDFATVKVGAGVQIFLGDGTGKFTAMGSSSIDGAPSAADDVDGDGKLDIVVRSTILFGDGKGGFGRTQVINAGGYPNALATSDINEDGLVDIVYSTRTSSFSVVYQLATGLFSEPKFFAGPPQVLGIFPVDFDLDSDVDLVLVDPTEYYGGVAVHLNDSGFEKYSSVFSGPSLADNAIAADFNLDGKDDVIMSYSGVSFKIFLTTTSGYATTEVLTSAGRLVKGDFNKDGKLDFAVGTAYAEISVYLNDGTGIFTKKAVLYSTGFVVDILAGDFNDDGNLDLLTLSTASSSNMSFHAGNGTGTYPTQVLSTVNGSPYTAASGDFNLDGRLDLVVGFQNETLSIMRGLGTGTFEVVSTIDAGSFVGVSDLNGDNIDDITYSGRNDAIGLHIILGIGNNQFKSPIQYLDQVSGPIVFDDFNGDGAIDIFVRGGVNAVCYSGNSDGTFSNRRGFGTGTFYSLISADTNGDKKPDVVFFGPEGTGVLENTTARIVIPPVTDLGCGDNSVELTLSGSSAFCQWSGPVEGTGTKIIARYRGTYTVTSSNFGVSCLSQDAINIVGPPAPPKFKIDQPTCVEENGTIDVLNAELDDKLSFDNGATYGTVFNARLIPGQYKIIIKDAKGCTSAMRGAEILKQPVTPSEPVIQTTDPTCFENTGSGLIGIQRVDDTYSFDGGMTFQSDHKIIGLTPGVYSVVIRSVGGCLSPTKQFKVGRVPTKAAEPVVNVVNPSCTDPMGTVTISLQRPDDTYSFDGGVTFQPVNTKVLPSGAYQVFVRTIDNCVSAGKGVLVANQLFIPNKPTVTSVSTGASVLLTSSPGDHYQWFANGKIIAGATLQMYETSEDGLYTVVVTSNDGCESIPSDPVSVLILGEIAFDQYENPFPNPTSDYLYFRTAPSENLPVLYDVTGKLIDKRPFQSQDYFAFEVRDLAPGLYIVKFESTAGTIIFRWLKR